MLIILAYYAKIIANSLNNNSFPQNKLKTVMFKMNVDLKNFDKNLIL